jgi:hypothetical protein
VNIKTKRRGRVGLAGNCLPPSAMRIFVGL